MSGMDEIGIDIGQLTKLANTNLNVVNGHTTLWTAKAREEVAEEPVNSEELVNSEDPELDSGSDTVDDNKLVKRSYYGDVDLGPAKRSQFNSSSFIAVAAFVFDPNVVDTEHMDEVTSLQLNTPATYMTPQELRDYEAIKPCIYKPPGENAQQLVAEALYVAGKTLYTPSEADIFRQTYVAMAQYPDTFKPMSVNKMPVLRDHFRYYLCWKISLPRLKAILLKKHRVLSIGSIPVAFAERMKEEDSQARQNQYQELPTRKVRHTKAKGEPWTEEQKQAHREETKRKRKRLAAPIPDLFQQLDEIESFQQKDDTIVNLTLHEDPKDRSYIRIRSSIRYKDESRPTEQPRHKVEITLTYRNTRAKGDDTDAQDYRDNRPEGDDTDAQDYRPTERIVDVSDKASIPTLAALFPHLARQNPKFWDQLYATLECGHKLTLVQFHHNEHPCTSNLFTPRENMPQTYNDLRVIIRHSPLVYLLVRGSDVNVRFQSVVNRFVELARFNPLLNFFAEPINPYVNHKGIKPTNELPKFVTLPEYAFETWDELAVHCGVRGIIEQRFGIQNQVHRGLASAHPVPHTQTRDDLDIALYLNFSKEDASSDVPKLTASNPVKVDFDNYKENTASKHAWHRRVVAPAPATAIGQVCIIVHRPFNLTEGLIDQQKHTTLSVSNMESMDTGTLQAWARDNLSLRVTVFKNNDTKECKRLALALERIRVFSKMRKEYVPKEHLMKQLRTMLLCHDHNNYDKTSLFNGIHDDDRMAFINILPQLLKGYQYDAITKWLDQGVLANTVVLGGISSSSKT